MKTKTRVQIAREASTKTQKQVASEIGVAEQQYQRYEYGEHIPNAITAQRMASALGTTVGELFPVGDVTDSA